MTQHEQIQREMTLAYESMRDADIVGPGSLAFSVYQSIANGEEAAGVQYTSVEHLKAMARKFLARRNDADGDESVAHNAQGEFSFSGQLQDRYPLPRQRGEEPAYIKRGLLTPEQRAWNVDQLRKSARARLAHADALEAEGTDIPKAG